MNFYKHHIGDYDAHTGHLSILEDGVYCRLLRRYYLTERPLPSDLKELAHLIRARSRWEVQALARCVNLYFSVASDGTLHNSRADEEILKYQAQASTNRKIARQRFVNDSKSVRSPNQNQIPEPRTIPINTSSIEPTRDEHSKDPFDDFESQNHDDYPEMATKPRPQKLNGEKWWLSNASIDAKGREYDVVARSGEDYASFKNRIFEEIAKRRNQQNP